MTLHQIKLFLAIAEELSFSRGAARVSVTQSTASQHIATLEDELGLQLFDRTRNGAVLTQEGVYLLSRARKVLLSCQSVTDAAAEISGQLATRLRVGCSNIPSLYLIPQLLPELQQSHPELTLTLVQAGSSVIISSLREEEIELAVVGSCDNRKEVTYTPLCSDELVLVVHPDHPWVLNRSISLAMIAKEPLLMREPGSGSAQSVFDATHEAGFDIGKDGHYSSLGSNEAIKESILSGYGVSFLSALSVRREVARGDLVIIDVPGFKIERMLYLAVRKRRALSVAGEIFRDLILSRYR